MAHMTTSHAELTPSARQRSEFLTERVRSGGMDGDVS